MIIAGYPGIGKSTIASRDLRFIDLESSIFWLEDTVGHKYRPDNWDELYCKTAEWLSMQGYIVFVSSHPNIIERLCLSRKKFVLIYPSISLRKEWLSRLYKRYNETNNDKDLRAYEHVSENYYSDIERISMYNCEHFRLNTMEYNLQEICYDLLGED